MALLPCISELTKCFIRYKTMFDHLRLNFNTAFILKVGVKYQYSSRAVCGYAETRLRAYRSICANWNEHGK